MDAASVSSVSLGFSEKVATNRHFGRDFSDIKRTLK